jgi:osmotically-inducible protein OsmY
MKTDAQLKQDMLAELRRVETIRVGVRVRDGVAMLTGFLREIAEIEAVEKAARRVAGVKAIAMEFDFEPKALPSELQCRRRPETAQLHRAAS